MRISKKLSALGAFFVIAAVVAGCGSSIPGNSVAIVAGNPITLKAYDHWMYVFAVEEASQQSGEPVIVPQTPPKFTSCIAQVRREIPTLSTTPAAQLKKDCAQVFTQYNTSVMNFLIESYWDQADAYKMGIRYTTADLNKDFKKVLKTDFPNGTFKTYLKSSGETEADIKFQIRASQIAAKLVKRASKPVNAAAIASYYNAHKSAYGTPENA